MSEATYHIQVSGDNNDTDLVFNSDNGAIHSVSDGLDISNRLLLNRISDVSSDLLSLDNRLTSHMRPAAFPESVSVSNPDYMTRGRVYRMFNSDGTFMLISKFDPVKTVLLRELFPSDEYIVDDISTGFFKIYTGTYERNSYYRNIVYVTMDTQTKTSLNNYHFSTIAGSSYGKQLFYPPIEYISEINSIQFTSSNYADVVIESSHNMFSIESPGTYHIRDQFPPPGKTFELVDFENSETNEFNAYVWTDSGVLFAQSIGLPVLAGNYADFDELIGFLMAGMYPSQLETDGYLRKVDETDNMGTLIETLKNRRSN